MKKIAVVLAGSGVFDGSEIHEATATLLAINKAGASYQCIAPNSEQMHAINHASSIEHEENRNILEESARIARGDILDLATVSANDFDVIIFPGGFGAAKNLSTFAIDGSNIEIEVTIGNDEATVTEIEKTGAKHITTTVEQIYVDTTNKIVTTSAYMLAENISQVFDGVEACVNKVIELI